MSSVRERIEEILLRLAHFAYDTPDWSDPVREAADEIMAIIAELDEGRAEMGVLMRRMAARLDELEPEPDAPKPGSWVFVRDRREWWEFGSGEWVVHAVPPLIVKNPKEMILSAGTEAEIEARYGKRPVFVPGRWSVEWSGSSRAYEDAFPAIHKQIAADVADLIKSNQIPPDPGGSRRKEGNADEITETTGREADGQDDPTEGDADA